MTATDAETDWADDHGYVRWAYRCAECGYKASGWSDTPMDAGDKCPECGSEQEDGDDDE